MPNKITDFNKKIAFLLDVIKRYDHYIGTTNFKVGLMMSFLAAVILGLIMRILALTSTKTEISITCTFACIFVFITIACSLYAVARLFRVVFPNLTTQAGSTSLIFFDDVSACRNGADGYFEKIVNASMEEIAKDMATQTYILAGIVKEKFQLLQSIVNFIKFTVLPLLAISIFFLIISGMQ